MASEDIAKLAESLAKTKVGGGQLSFKGQSLKLNTAEDGKRKDTFRSTFLLHEKTVCSSEMLFDLLSTFFTDSNGGAFYVPY